MTDFADTASDTEQMFLDIAIRHHAQRCQRPEALPVCTHCESNPPHITKIGVVLAYCDRCAIELGHEQIGEY